ncbi:MAG TPA: hypothetical protein VD816_10440 [Ohtaekwangia sp.]|nr:hypothetical protein [Ohtaekwangia sp.]
MNKIKSVLLVSFILAALTTSAQEETGDLQMKKSFWGTKFISGGQLLKPKQVLQLMESSPEAHAEFKKAKTNYDVANVFGAIGGFMIGFPLGTAVGGGDPEWGLAAGGAAVVLVAIPFSIAFTKRAKHAVDLYNGNPASSPTSGLYISPYGAGAKVVWKF